MLPAIVSNCDHVPVTRPRKLRFTPRNTCLAKALCRLGQPFRAEVSHKRRLQLRLSTRGAPVAQGLPGFDTGFHRLRPLWQGLFQGPAHEQGVHDPANWPKAQIKASPFPKARLRYMVRSPTMIGQLVSEGMGMSYLPYSAQDWIPGLVEMPGCKPFLDRSIWLLLHSDLRRTTRVRVLIDHLAQEIRALRAIFLGPLA